MPYGGSRPCEGHIDTRKQSLQAAKQAVNIDRKAEHRPGRRVLAMLREECSPHKPGLCAPSLPRHLLMHMQRLPEALAATGMPRALFKAHFICPRRTPSALAFEVGGLSLAEVLLPLDDTCASLCS